MPRKCFFVIAPDGRLRIMHPAYDDATRTIKDDAEFEATVVDSYLRKLEQRDWFYLDPTVSLPLIICGQCLESDLPTDRYFRDAWEWED